MLNSLIRLYIVNIVYKKHVRAGLAFLIILIPIFLISYRVWTVYDETYVENKLDLSNGALPFTKPDVQTQISFDNFPFLNLNIPICKKSTEILVMIISKAGEFHRRNIIRNEWANPREYNAVRLRALFLVGYEEILESSLHNEEKAFHDIIITKLKDNYYNLSIKTLMAMAYAKNYCPKIKCFIKSDSDNILNLENFEELCHEHKNKESIVGFCNVKTNVDRNLTSKWYVPHYVYADDKYPQYCSGGFYMMTGKYTINKLLSNLDKTPFMTSSNFRFLPEDVIFTGILANITNIRRINNPGFNGDFYPTTECKNHETRLYGIHVGRFAEKEDNYMFLYFIFLKYNRRPC